MIYACVICLALLNVPQHPKGLKSGKDPNQVVLFIPNILICMIRIVSAIVGPLIMIVLPGSFYYYAQ